MDNSLFWSVRNKNTKDSTWGVYRGTYVHSIDAKGRTSVPAKFRSKLCVGEGEPIILSPGFDEKSLILWPPKVWMEFEENLASRPMFDPTVQKLKFAYVAPSMECSLDKQGRILIPPTLREFAQLTKEVYWVGHVNLVLIYSKENFDSVVEAAHADREAINNEAAALGL